MKQHKSWLRILGLTRNRPLPQLWSSPNDALDDRFVEACQMLDYIEYLADILTVGDLEERVAVVDELMKESKIAFLRNYVARKRKEGLSHGEER